VNILKKYAPSKRHRRVGLGDYARKIC
jgi:phosphoenolpyruvate carboxylase